MKIARVTGTVVLTPGARQPLATAALGSPFTGMASPTRLLHPAGISMRLYTTFGNAAAFTCCMAIAISLLMKI